VTGQATGRLSVGVSLRLHEQNAFAALRRSGNVGTDRERQAQQGCGAENTKDIVKRKPHVSLKDLQN
jgi:hypothetical protein